MSQDEEIVLRAGIRPLKGRKIRYFTDKWMREKSAIAPPVVPAHPFDPAIARRSLAVIAQVEGDGGTGADGLREMSDAEVVNGVDHADLVGFAIDGLPADGDPRKAVGFFQGLGLDCEVEDFDDAADVPPCADAAADAFGRLG